MGSDRRGCPPVLRVHENGRFVPASQPLLAERLEALGMATAAFVSGYPLVRQFGLARGFELYDDQLGPGGTERSAGATTDAALAYLAGAGNDRPLFLWVHYYDPHEPYAPPEPFRSRFAANPYRGEIAYLDQELGRLLAAFEGRFGPERSHLLVVGDHGESLGEHGEAHHGDLLYQGAMRVPLILVAPGLAPAEVSQPVSTRRLFDTLLGWARGEAKPGLLAGTQELVLGEAMKPYLDYGWQPQWMVVRDRLKVIRSAETEIYDLAADPAENHDLSGRLRLDRELAEALESYPLPGSAPARPLTSDEQKRLAALGYVAAQAPPRLRADAPSPRKETAVLADLDLGSGLFVRERYAEAIPVFRRVLERDPGNWTAALRLAAACSALGREREADGYFRRAGELEPDSLDLKLYLGLDRLRRGRLAEAEPLLASVLAASPQRLPALEALATIRERQQRLPEAIELLTRAAQLQADPTASLLRLGDLNMALGRTPEAIEAFEGARSRLGEKFPRSLELGVLYLAAHRFAEARDALDRVPPGHPGYPMALFKRAQVSVLLGEPDREARIAAARAQADATTRPLIENERLFRQGG